MVHECPMGHIELFVRYGAVLKVPSKIVTDEDLGALIVVLLHQIHLVFKCQRQTQDLLYISRNV